MGMVLRSSGELLQGLLYGSYIKVDVDECAIRTFLIQFLRSQIGHDLKYNRVDKTNMLMHASCLKNKYSVRMNLQESASNLYASY